MTLEPQKTIPTHVVYHGHPLLPAADRREFNMVLENGTLQQLLDQFPDQIHRLDVIAYVNGDVVPRLAWADYKIKAGDEVVLKQRVSGDNSNPLQIILMIAVIALSVYTGGLVGAAYGATWGAVAQAAVMVAGTLIVQALFPPQMPKGEKADDFFTITGTRNTPRFGEPLPIVVGTVKMYPDVGMKPYVEQDSQDAYLSSTFNYGFGDLVIANTKIGNTDIDDYQEVAYQWANTGAQLDLIAGNVDSLEGGELKEPDGWVTRTTGANTTRIGLDFGGSLFKSSDEGEIQLNSVQVEIQYKATSSNTWLPWTGNVSAQSYASVVLGRFSRAFFGQGGNADGNGLYTIWWGQTKPLRWSVIQSVEEGTYDVRVRRVTKEYTSTKKNASIQLGQIRAFQKDPANYNYQTRLGVRIRATGQLQGQIDALNSIVSAKIPTWNGSAWTAGTSVSSNPAAVYLYLARGLRDGTGKRLFGAGLADSRIDLAGLGEWYEWCETKGLECNYVFQSPMTIYEMLSLVARCGRGSVSWQKGTLGVVYDREALPVTQIFTPASIISDTFNVVYMTKNLADEITVKFVNKDLDYQEDTVTVKMPGVTDAQNPAEITLLGVTTPNVAFKEASLMAARQYYNRRRVSFDTDVEGLVCAKGDVISVSHDLTSWGTAGRLLSGNTTVLQLDREITFNSANTAYMGIRQPNGTYTVHQVVNPYAGSPVVANTVTMSSALSFNPNTDGDNDPRDYMFIFDYAATPGKKLKVTAVVPNGENVITIHAIDEVAEYYDAENGSSTYVPPNLIHTSDAYVTNVVVTEQYQGYGQPLRIFIQWDLVQARGARLEVRMNNGTWNDYGVIDGAEYELDLVSWKSGDLLDISLSPVEFVQSKYATNVSQTSYTILGLPNVVTDITLPRITGLEISPNRGNTNEFGGKDAVFVWRKVQTVREEVGSETLGAETGTLDPYFQDYEIRIYDSTGTTLLRTEYATSETYAYTWEKNSEDNAGQAVRSFRISVRYRSKTNQVGEAAVMVATNPAPAAPVPSVSTILKNLYVQTTRPSDIDIAGMEVHVGASSGFTPNAATLVHRGPESSATIDAGLVYDATYYVKVGFSDGFSNSAVNFSAANTVTPTMLGDGDIQDAINSRYGLFNTDAWVQPPTDPMGDWDLFAGNVANSSVNVAAIGPYNTTSPTLTIVGDGSATGWYSKWRHNFDVVPDRAYISYTWVRKISANTDRGLYLGFTEDALFVEDLNGTGNSNPYFVENAGATMTEDKWYLAVGVIQANSAASNTGLSGLYDPETGGRLIEASDFKHAAGANTQYVRIGFNSTTTAFANTDGFEIAAPSAFLMDGAEPTISYMLRRSYQQGALAALDEISITEFASGIEPVQIVSTLPVSVSGNSNTVLLTSDSKLYRWNGSAYTASVANTDFTGEIISTQISDGAISTPKLAANSVTASIIAANAVTSNAIEANAVTAGKIAVGAVSADQILANAITASKLAITNQGMAVNRDPSINANAWFATIYSSTPANTYAEFTNVYEGAPAVGNVAFQYSGSTGKDFSSESMPIDGSKVYRISVWVNQTAGTIKNYLTACFLDKDGAVITAGSSGWSTGTYLYWGLVNQQGPSGYTKYSVVFGPGQSYTMPSGARFLRIGALVNYGSTDTGTIRFQDYRLEEVLGGQLIVDGTITAAKITVANLSSVKADMGAINAGTIVLDTTGYIRSGMSGYNSGSPGFWLGKDGATSKFAIGNPSGKKITWDGTNMNVTGTIQSTNFSSGSAGYRLLDSGSAEFNDVTVRGSVIANTANAANIRVEIDPSSQFIMWAGKNTKDANTSNAVYYLRANGQAYFGGDILSAFKPRAWARFYGKSSGAFITRQFNIGSITRIQQGIYQFNFATALPNPYYCVMATTNQQTDSTNPLIVGAYSLTTSGFRLNCKNAGGNYRDTLLGSVVVFGSDEAYTAPPAANDPWTWDGDYNSYPPGTVIP